MRKVGVRAAAGDLVVARVPVAAPVLVEDRPLEGDPMVVPAAAGVAGGGAVAMTAGVAAGAVVVAGGDAGEPTDV